MESPFVHSFIKTKYEKSSMTKMKPIVIYFIRYPFIQIDNKRIYEKSNELALARTASLGNVSETTL